MNFLFIKFEQVVCLPDLFLLFSHELTNQQKREAIEELGVEAIKYLPDSLKELWSQIPPEVPEVAVHLRPIKAWLEGKVKKGDYILIQGDFGATFIMVQWSFVKNCIPIYATTKRKVIEVYNNHEVITNRVFEHIRFRPYEKIE